MYDYSPLGPLRQISKGGNYCKKEYHSATRITLFVAMSCCNLHVSLKAPAVRVKSKIWKYLVGDNIKITRICENVEPNSTSTQVSLMLYVNAFETSVLKFHQNLHFFAVFHCSQLCC